MAAGREAAFDEAILQGAARGLRTVRDTHAVTLGGGGAHDLQRSAGCIERRNDAAADAGAARVDDGTARKRTRKRGSCGKDLEAAPGGQTLRA